MMSIQKRTCVATFVAIGLVGVAVAGCAGPPEAAPARGQTDERPRATRVSVVRPERATIRHTTAQPGQIEPFEVTPIHAKLAGYLVDLPVNIGDVIKKGDVLARLSVPELEAERLQKQAAVTQAEADSAQAEAAVAVADAGVTHAQASLTEVQATVRRAEADVARWQAEYRRVAQLARESAVTGSLLDETRSKLEAANAASDEAQAKVTSAKAAEAEAEARLAKARADLGSAAAAVAVARADLRRVEALLGYSTIHAPYDGVVTRRNADTGLLTVPGGQAEPLLIVARTDQVTVEVGVPEADAPLIGPGDRAEIRLPALGDRVVTGQVTRTSWILDLSTRTLRAEIDLPNPEGALRPGLYAYATILADEHKDVPTVPTTAVLRDKGKAYVVIVADGQAHRREVQLGLSDGTRIEVISGLNGEAVVKNNPEALEEGQPVEVVEPASTARKTGR
jgi:HlyD family secretion protein